MKYYFITYQATNRDGRVSIWNDVIDTSPMKFIKDVEHDEEQEDGAHRNFVVINTCEISEDEFKTYDKMF